MGRAISQPISTYLMFNGFSNNDFSVWAGLHDRWWQFIHITMNGRNCKAQLAKSLHHCSFWQKIWFLSCIMKCVLGTAHANWLSNLKYALRNIYRTSLVIFCCWFKTCYLNVILALLINQFNWMFLSERSAESADSVQTGHNDGGT